MTTSYLPTITLSAVLLFAVAALMPERARAQEMTDEQMAMMQAWQDAGTPGDEHAWLAEMAGTWNVESSWRMEPGGDWTTSEGKAEREMILGGRVLREWYSSEFNEQPFEGVAKIGYDNVTESWWNTWTDNMSTGLATGSGECAEDHSQCTWTLKGSDPMTGGTSSFRIVIQYEDGRETHTMYETRDGEEFKSMESVYTRAE